MPLSQESDPYEARNVGGSDASEVILRPTVASESDGIAFARLLDQAQEGWYRFALGSAAGRLLSGVFMEPNHELSHEFVTVAEIDGQVVGMSLAYSGRARSDFGPDPLTRVAGGMWRYRAMTRFTRRMLRFLAQVPSGDFYVRALAVDPDFRGHGIGSLLLGDLIEKARASGCRRLALDVASTNRDARRLYERIGMTKEAESPRYFGLPNTNVIRMVEDL